MNRGHGFATLVALSLGNGLLIGAALETAHPMQYLALAAGLGTFVNLTYVLAARLWRVSGFEVSSFEFAGPGLISTSGKT